MLQLSDALPSFDKLGSHTYATTPCSGRVRDYLWTATITVTGGWMRRGHVYLRKAPVLLHLIQGRMEGMSKTVVVIGSMAWAMLLTLASGTAWAVIECTAASACRGTDGPNTMYGSPARTGSTGRAERTLST